MRHLVRLLAATLVCAFAVARVPAASIDVETLQSVFAVSAAALNRIQEPVAFVVARTGEYLVLDRRAHTVFSISADGRTVRQILQIGFEPGRILQPADLALGADDIFAVLDAPNGLQRIQYFAMNGMRINGFYLPIKGVPVLVSAGQTISGAAAMAFTGKTFLVNEPAWGSLLAELDTHGTVIRHIGLPRATGFETDNPKLHVALNVGLPVVDPTGGFFFVFQTGLPVFRKYDAHGQLVFERHIEGPELDGLIQSLPTTWRTSAGTYAVPPSLVRTAAADRSGRLWVSLQTPYTYVYDGHGDKTRVVQFRGADVMAASSLFFKPDGRVLVGPGGYEFDAR